MWHWLRKKEGSGDSVIGFRNRGFLFWENEIDLLFLVCLFLELLDSTVYLGCTASQSM